jgi:hypothetical protein
LLPSKSTPLWHAVAMTPPRFCLIAWIQFFKNC